MRISIIVAASQGGVIGKDGGIPWRLPEDLKRFKRLTMGHHLVMGRKTHESIGKVLPGRITMVLTRERFRDVGPEAWRMWSLDESIAHAERAGESELFVCGGGEVYKEALPRTGRIYLTVVEGKYDGDTFFTFDRVGWKLANIERGRGDVPHLFETWERT